VDCDPLLATACIMHHAIAWMAPCSMTLCPFIHSRLILTQLRGQAVGNICRSSTGARYNRSRTPRSYHKSLPSL
jgi:hypothetical protein